MNGETGAPVCLTVRDVEMFTTPGMVARATDGNPFGAAPVSATGSGGALVAGLTQPDPAVSSTPETTPTTRKIPAITPTRNERRSSNMQSAPVLVFRRHYTP